MISKWTSWDRQKANQKKIASKKLDNVSFEHAVKHI